MRSFRKIWLIFCLAVILWPATLYAQNDNKWLPSKGVAAHMKKVAHESDIRVYTSPSLLIIEVNEPVTVQIFTILGKLVSSQKLEPGLYEYKLPSQGIYIIKTQDTTCKIAV